VRLVPRDLLYEARALVPRLAPGGSYATFSDPNMSGGAGHRFDPNQPGNWIAYDLDIPRAGEFSLRVGVKKQDQRGIYQVL
jgi:hypothetical protein